MSPMQATAVYVCGILGLFWLDRERPARTSWAVWIPVMWLFIAGSRHVSQWLGPEQAASPEAYLEGSPLDASIYALLIALAFYVLFQRRDAVARILRKNWPILLFVAYCLMSVSWSDYPGVALKRWIKSLGDYAMILILLTEKDRTQAIKQALSRVAFVVLPVSVLLIKYFPDLGRAYAAHWDATTFYVGIADTKNMLGMICMVFGFAAAWQLLHCWSAPRRERNRILLVQGAILGMALWLLYMSDSKTSLACFAMTTGLVAAHTFLPPARKRAVLHILVVAVVLCSFSVLFLGIGSGALETLGRNSTLTGRTEMWDLMLQVPINPVFGTGFESYWLGKHLTFLWQYQIMNGITEAHNGYLETYLNLGWAGLALLAVLFWTGYRNILRLLETDPEAGRLRLGFLVIAIVYNFTEAGIRTTDLVWIALILAIAAFPQLRAAKTTVVEAPPAVREPEEVEQFA